MTVMTFLRRALLGGFAALALTTSLRAIEPGEFWTTFNLSEYKSGAFETRSHAEFRFPELEWWSYMRLSQKFYYKLDNGITLGLHPTYEQSRKSDGGDWSETYRLDLEANYGFKVGDFSIKTRNRYEVRRKEGKGSEAFDRLRQYTTVSYPAKWLPGMSSIGIGNEVFVEFDDTRVTLNRFYPIMVTFKALGGKISPYAMYQTKRVGSTNDWRENWVLGTSGSWSF